MMAGIIYTACSAMSLLCAALLLAAFRRSGHRLLLWGGLCFSGLTLGSAVLIADKLVFTAIDLSTERYAVTLASLAVLLYGMIWDVE
jgi:hypothetical protein